MPRSPSNQCYECRRYTSTECSVCHSGFCADHGVVLRTFGVIAPGQEYYCARCYQDFSELHGTQSCSAEGCEFLTNDTCSSCQKPCCSEHCLVEHLPLASNSSNYEPMSTFGGSSQQQDPEKFQKLNKTQICDDCASKKYLQRRGGIGGGAALIIIIIIIIVLSQK